MKWIYKVNLEYSVCELQEAAMGSVLWKSIIFLILQLSWVSGENKVRSELEKEIFQKLFLASKFHIYVRPHKSLNQTTDEPLDIFVSLFILNIDVDIKKQECSVQMYFRQEWNDSRLSYNDQGKITFLSIHDAVGLWTPDLFFVNEKLGHLHTVTKPNTFVRIYPEGRVLYSQRVTVKFACPMDFRKYPFDTQICVLPIESYGYTASDLLLRWKPETTFGENEPDGFKVSYTTTEEVVQMAVNSYGRLGLNIHLARLIYPQLIHIYLPLTLLVIASWASFCLRPSDPALRLTTVLITTFTTLIFVQSVKEFLHPQSYLTALDIWLGFSCLLIFAAVFENIYVLANHGDKSLTFQTPAKKDVTELPDWEKDKWKWMDIFAGKMPQGDTKVDMLARLLFPSVFVLFNIIYLAFYLI